ncbi:hypothetical protein SAMN05443582_103460 [Phyllobacterium sp. OV277]|nr:hypothetical protein SAMN05443582_103460 [Phyllobacterium sp. OV277]
MRVVRGPWFDKLTMREIGDATIITKIAEPDSLQPISLPHGELVEPRTTNHAPAALTPLCPVGHLPHKGGDHIGMNAFPQQEPLQIVQRQ